MKYQYDEEASAAWNMDVVHEYDDTPVTVDRWLESRRRLNSINDPLARKILALHERCGTSDGECDGEEAPEGDLAGWPCPTTQLVADHFGIEYPPSDWDAAKTNESD